ASPRTRGAPCLSGFRKHGIARRRHCLRARTVKREKVWGEKPFGTGPGTAADRTSAFLQSIAVGHRFEFHANGISDGDHRASLEGESRQHRTELMHLERIIT